MDIKDKLNLAFKFLFLAVFTYGVLSLTCCSSDCGSNTSSACCKSETKCSKTAESDAPCTKGKK